MASLSTVAKAELISQACQSVFGFRPVIYYTETQAKIRFTPEQNKIIADYFTQMMDDKNPPEIDVDLQPIIMNWAVKTGFPYVIGLLAGGGIAGYLLARYK
jgi:hypothetical protein